MTVAEVAQIVEGKIVCAGSEGLCADKVFVGDFLSRVMGKADSGCVWITVMSNVNVAAVACLADIKIVVLCEGSTPDSSLVDRLQGEGIALITTSLSAYKCCKLL